jgi:hypothetical protein
MNWWHWRRAERALENWVRVLIGTRPYTIRFDPGKGSFVRFDTQEIVIDPVMTNNWGGEALLPVTWRGEKVSKLASLQWRISRAMGRHEAGHVLFTERYGISGQLHAWLCNALEDERMERLTGAHYPPARADFLTLARLLATRMPLPETPASREDALLNACLFWRWDSKRPAKTPSRLRFASEADHQLWEAEIRPLVEESWVAPNAGRVAELALEILRRLGLPEHDNIGGHVLIITDRIPGSAERRPGDEPLMVSTTDLLPDGNEDDSETNASASNDIHTGDEGEPPESDSDPSTGSLWQRPYGWLVAEVAGETRRLLKVLQAPAPDIGSRRSGTHGTFTAEAHARTRGERPLMVKREVEQDPSGLAIVLLIDRTGSMGPMPGIDPVTGEPDVSFFDERARVTHARRAAMLFELTCTAADIPLAIGYAGDYTYSVHLPDSLNEATLLHHPDKPVIWLRTWQTPRYAEGPKALIAGLYGDSGSERVSASLCEAERLLLERPERTKLVLYVHDGQPSDEKPHEVAATITALRRKGIVVLGVYVGPQEKIAKLQAIFGSDQTIPVERLTDLPARLGRLLLKYKHGG